MEEPEQKPQGGIYAIKHNDSGKCYVGSTTYFPTRFRGHRYRLKKGTHDNKKLQTAWDTFGSKAFTIYVIENIDDKSLFLVREQFWIDRLNAFNDGFNMCPNAVSSLGIKRTAETRKRMSKAKSGRTLSEAHKKKLSEVKKGKKFSPEFCRNISEKMKAHWKKKREIGLNG